MIGQGDQVQRRKTHIPIKGFHVEVAITVNV